MTNCVTRPISYLHEAIHTIVSIYKGHMVTLKNLFRPKVTLQYPEVRHELPTGYRGIPSLPVDPETGQDICIGCGACARVCPTQLITVDTHVGEDKKRVVDEFYVKAGLCMFCGLCQEVCPVDAIILSDNYELFVFSKDDLVYNRERLHKFGGTRAPKQERVGGEAAPTKTDVEKA